jgi:hypothetical protein
MAILSPRLAHHLDTALAVLGVLFLFGQIAFSQKHWQNTFESARHGRLLL